MQGIFEIYKDYVLVNKLNKLPLVTEYNQSPGRQCHQLGRILQMSGSGLVFFVLAQDKYTIGFINLDADQIFVQRISAIQLEAVTSFYVHQPIAESSLIEPLKNSKNIDVL